MRIPVVLLLALFTASPCLADPPRTDTSGLDFGTVVADEVIERTITVTNPGAEDARIRDVQLTPPLTVTRMNAVVPAGGSSTVTVRFGAARPPGRYEGEISVNFAGGLEPLVLPVSAELVPAIELRPRPELVAVTSRGTAATDSLEIVSHLPEPIELAGGAQSTDRWTTSLEELEHGRRWRLTLHLRGDGAAGKRTDQIVLQTSDAKHPRLPVRVRTSLRERVSTFPDRVEFGRLVAGSIDASTAALYETSVMIYQSGGTSFEVKASTDVPFLVVRPEKSQKFGDRWQVFLSIDPARLVAGQRGGTLVLETNDEEFPRIEVPVTASVEAGGGGAMPGAGAAGSD